MGPSLLIRRTGCDRAAPRGLRHSPPASGDDS